MKKPLTIGCQVRYTGPSLFESGRNWTGIVKRLPILKAQRGQKLRDTDHRVLVDAGRKRKGMLKGQPNLRPVRAEYLEVV
jgi:hypothetical protein